MNIRLELPLALTFVACATICSAATTPDDAARLGTQLTAVGAIAGANADGSIPAWSGGTPPSGTDSNGFPRDSRIDRERPLFTITPSNYLRYADRLTEGHKALLTRYADYRMLVYPTHRTASLPSTVNLGSVANANHCSLMGTDELNGCVIGIPFPIPKSGAEVIWNHKLRWRGAAVERYDNQFIVYPDGGFTQNRLLEQVKYYYQPSANTADDSGHYDILRFLAHTLSPARIDDSYLLIHERTGNGGAGRDAWVYRSRLERLRRVTSLEYDTPFPDTEGAQNYDQVDMFSGALDNFDWKLVGEKELYLPYNSDRIAGDSVRYNSLLLPGHINQDLARYELHRYWIVEAELKQGKSHLFSLRRFYVDEDSWNIEAVDNYDNHGRIVNVQEGHLVHFANAQVTTAAPEVIYDLVNGKYFVARAFNEDRAPAFNFTWPDDYFTPASLSGRIVR
jgi:hypothetical protein